MKLPRTTFCIVSLLLAGRAIGAPDAAAASAELAAKNIAVVSSALTAFQRGLNATADSRARHILSVRSLAYDGRQETERELDILKKTDGAELVKVLGALREHGDKAALSAAEAEAANAAAKVEIAAAYAPLEISTEKLDKAAKSLAGLAKQQSDSERASFLFQFFKETRDETKKLLDESKDSSDKADKKLASAASAAASSSAAALKKVVK